MSKLLADFQSDFQEEVGDLSALYVAGEVERWVNEGRTRLPLEYDTAEIFVAAGATTVALPADLISVSRVEPADDGDIVPEHRVWGRTALVLLRAATSANTIRVYYRRYSTVIEGSTESELTDEGDRALLSYALYRFFKKLASSRVNYRRYATLVGQNAVGIEDLQAEADRHYQDYLESVDALPLDPPSFFYPRGS